MIGAAGCCWKPFERHEWRSQVTPAAASHPAPTSDLVWVPFAQRIPHCCAIFFNYTVQILAAGTEAKGERR